MKENGPKSERESKELSPDVSVIVANWNLKNMLRDCLVSVEKHSGEIVTELIVVDNASSDGSARMVASEFPEALLIRNSKNAGFSRASNQGIRAASGKYLFLLNNDALLSEDALATMAAFLDSHADVGICGPRVINEDGSLQFRSRGRYPSITTAMVHFFIPQKWQRYGSLVFGIYDNSEVDAPVPIDWVSGCALMARRQAVESVGMLDANVFMYCEDVDWCYRMHKAGWKVFYIPDAEVMHYGGQSMRQQKGKVVAAHAKGLVSYYEKYHGPLATNAFRFVLLFGYGLKALGWIGASLAGRKAGLNKLMRMLVGRKTGPK